MSSPKMPERNKYPFNQLEIGGYVKLEFPNQLMAMKARIAAGSHGKYHGKKFVTSVKGSVLEVWRKS